MLTEFEGRTAVVTGAGSGIGLGLARRCRERGMNVAMLDVEAERALARRGRPGGRLRSCARAHRSTCRLRRRCRRRRTRSFARFGGVHLLCNNAGVSITGPAWTMTVHDCEWVVGVNLIGVLHGIRSFVSRMLEQADEGHVVNTSSLAGLTPMPHASLYSGDEGGGGGGVGGALLRPSRRRAPASVSRFSARGW